MNNAEFENQMFSRVNENCQMKELNRQEIERAAAEEYRFRCKCNKANAIIGIIVQVTCFVTTVFAVSVLNWLDEIPAVVGIAVTAVVGLFSGMSIQSLANRIKN